MDEDAEIRCPKLGGEVTFAYCMREAGDLPCSRVIRCWQPHFPVEAYVKTSLTQREWEQCFKEKPKEKIVTLIELIEAAKKRQQADRCE